MKVSFEIDKRKYQEAVAKGWNREYEEEIEPDSIGISETTIDLRFALAEVFDGDITNINIIE